MASAGDAEITIVGGGPVGLLTAFLCAEAGLETVVIEARPAIPQDLRATSFHPPTLDLLETIGLAEPLIRQGVICPSWQIRIHPSSERAVFDVSAIAGLTGHPFRLQCEQWRLSEALQGRLNAHRHATVLMGVRATGLEIDERTTTVHTESGDGRQERIAADFVVGADGLNSMVRAACGISFQGETLPETTLVVTTPFRFEDHLEGLSMVTSCWTPTSHVAFLRLPDFWRLALYPDETRPIEEQSTPAAIEAILQGLIPQSSPYHVLKQWPYRVQQRCASLFRVGRIAIAGDAAHVNSPAGGLGLNTGIHDAFALADALAEIIKRGAPLERLDTYDRQRRSIAEAILAQARGNRDRMRLGSLAEQRRALADLQETASDPERLRAFVSRASMIDALRRHDPDRLIHAGVR